MPLQAKWFSWPKGACPGRPDHPCLPPSRTHHYPGDGWRSGVGGLVAGRTEEGVLVREPHYVELEDAQTGHEQHGDIPVLTGSWMCLEFSGCLSEAGVVGVSVDVPVDGGQCVA